MKKNNILIYLCIALFGIVGIYLTFIAGNVSKYDSQTSAYRIDSNESWDSDNDIIYYPIYHYNVEGKDYECKAKTGSSSAPNKNKNTVYYDSSNPEKCKTEYEKSSSKLGGIICLAITAIILILVVKGPSTTKEEYNQINEIDPEKQYEINESVQKVEEIIDNVKTIYIRVILGIVIIVLIILTLVDTAILKQTIKSKDYIETTAIYTDTKNEERSNVLNDYIYIFEDKNENKHEIAISNSENSIPKETIKIRYNENNPQDYYDDGSTMDRAEIIWYIVRIIALFILITIFFNKKILNKINLTVGKK